MHQIGWNPIYDDGQQSTQSFIPFNSFCGFLTFCVKLLSFFLEFKFCSQVFHKCQICKPDSKENVKLPRSKSVIFRLVDVAFLDFGNCSPIWPFLGHQNVGLQIKGLTRTQTLACFPLNRFSFGKDVVSVNCKNRWDDTFKSMIVNLFKTIPLINLYAIYRLDFIETCKYKYTIGNPTRN